MSGQNDNQSFNMAKTIHLLALEGGHDAGLCAWLDAFAAASALGHAAGLIETPWTVRLVGVRPTVRSARGLGWPVQAADALPAPDLLLLPALQPPELGAEALAQRLAAPDAADARWQVLRAAEAGSRLAAACSGVVLLASIGLLDGARATTSWWLLPGLRQRHPAIRLEPDRLWVEDPAAWTAAGGAAHLDLALAWLASELPAVAPELGRRLLAAPRRSQAAYALAGQDAVVDPLAGRFERWAQARLARGFDLQDAAAALGLPVRTLHRRLHRALGRSPLAAFQALRVRHALQRLAEPGVRIEAVAAEVGYADAATLRSLLRRQLGQGLRSLREAGEGTAAASPTVRPVKLPVPLGRDPEPAPDPDPDADGR